MSRNSDTLLAFLIGAATGGVIALLLAPEKGEVTRGKIKRGASDLYGRGRGWADDTQQKVRGKSGEIVERARDKAQETVDAARQRVDAVKEAVTEGREAYRREMEKS